MEAARHALLRRADGHDGDLQGLEAQPIGRNWRELALSSRCGAITFVCAKPGELWGGVCLGNSSKRQAFVHFTGLTWLCSSTSELDSLG